MADKIRDEIEASKFIIWKSDMCSLSILKPICMLAHYASDEKIDENVMSYLRSLSNCGIDIILISTCETMPKTEIDKASTYCGLVITRKNLGYDFYSWKTGCRAYPAYASHPCIFWANDSVLVDERLIPRAIEVAFSSGAGIFGLTDCYRHGYHLQSYFLRFSGHTVASKEFHDFINSIAVHRHKPTIIRLYEIGLSRKMAAKHQLDSMISAKDLIPSAKPKPLRKLNPTIDTWKVLIEEYGFPFAKKELIPKRGVSIEEIRASFDHVNLSELPEAPHV
ncbi:MAG TPA: hypothetical protein VMX33_06310 [bacterium]|nr:hypothetical protein [bacterium]